MLDHSNIPEDLLSKYQAVQGLSAIHVLLLNGSYQYKHTQILNNSIQFVEALHSAAMSELKAHPDAHLVMKEGE